MPLARIITRSPQDAFVVSEYLRSQGYTVETVSPNEFRITPAEIELDLGRWGIAQALERARALVESGGGAATPAEVAAAPEAALPQEDKIAVAYDIAGRPVEFAGQQEVEPRQRHNSISSALVAMLSRGGAFLITGLAGVWQSVKAPAIEFQRKRAEQHALKLEAQLAREREEIRRQEQLARERVRREMERQREEAEVAERRRQEEIAAEQQEQERARVAALHEAMIAAERAAPPQPPSQMLVPESAPVLDATAASNLDALPAPAAPALEREIAAEPLRQQPRRSPERAQPVLARRRRTPIAISRTALATACSLSLLLLLGFVGYANRRPASQLLPGALRNDVKQDVPFGAATITPPAAASEHNPVKPAKSSAAIRRPKRKLPANQPGGKQVRSSSQDSSLANDEAVVRHLTPPPQPQPSTAKLKQHSDED